MTVRVSSPLSNSTARGCFPGGPHGGPAEKPFGDEQLPFSWTAIRYWPGPAEPSQTFTATPLRVSYSTAEPLADEPPMPTSLASTFTLGGAVSFAGWPPHAPSIAIAATNAVSLGIM